MGALWCPPLPLVLFLVCLVVSTLATPPRLPEAVATTDTIFVCLVGVDKATLWDTALHFLRTATNPAAVRVGILLFVADTHQARDASAWHHPQVSVRRQAVRRAEGMLCRGRRLCIRHLFHRERYVAFANGVRPVQNWDELMLRLAPDDAVTVAMPGRDGRACFPTLRKCDAGVVVRPRRFAVERACLTASTCWSHSFAFFRSGLLARCDLFVDSQINQASTLSRQGVACLVACCTVCTPSGEPGRTHADPSHEELDMTGCGRYPGVGVVSGDDSKELILKYGSIDSARVVIALDR